MYCNLINHIVTPLTRFISYNYLNSRQASLLVCQAKGQVKVHYESNKLSRSTTRPAPIQHQKCARSWLDTPAAVSPGKKRSPAPSEIAPTLTESKKISVTCVKRRKFRGSWPELKPRSESTCCYELTRVGHQTDRVLSDVILFILGLLIVAYFMSRWCFAPLWCVVTWCR